MARKAVWGSYKPKQQLPKKRQQAHPGGRRIAQPVRRHQPDERENRDHPDVVGQRRAFVPPEEEPREQHAFDGIGLLFSTRYV